MKKAILLALTLLLMAGTGVAGPFGKEIGMKKEGLKELGRETISNGLWSSPYLELTLLKQRKICWN